MDASIGARMKSVRQLTGATQASVAEAVGVSPEFISMVESGRKKPSTRLLSAIAEYFGRDVLYFLDDREQSFSAIFRAGTLTAENRRRLGRAERFAEDYHFLEALLGEGPQLAPCYPGPPAETAGSRSLYAYAESLANQERSRLNLGLEPIRDVFGLIESQGLRLIRSELGEGLAGVFLFSPSHGAYAVINATDTVGRQALTAAHEYCHYLKDRDVGFVIDGGVEEDLNACGRSPVERIATVFALDFLMPKSAVLQMASTLGHVGPEEVLYLKRYFGVSYQAMAYRLRALRRITQPEVESLLLVKPAALEAALGMPTEEEEAHALPATPDRFTRLALTAYLSDRISLGRLAEMLDKDALDLREALAESGMIQGSDGA
jgi:transcriptional regulator with XRE-family HTH domain/Zn-dependent peptidase ImmA (M78 family)